MDIYLVLVSLSVLNTNYNYCYEVPDDRPVRYFDGNVWRIMKPRPILRTMPKPINNITIKVLSSEIINYMNEKDIDDSATSTNNTTTEIITIKGLNYTDELTTKATTVNSASLCILKKITTTKKTVMTTKKSVPVKATKKSPPITTKKSSAKTAKKSPARTAVKPPSKSTKKPLKTTKKPPLRTTKKPPLKTPKKPIARTAKMKLSTKPIFDMDFAKPILRSGLEPTDSHDLLSAMKDLINALKTANKNTTPCKDKTTTPKISSENLLSDSRRAMNGVEDIMHLLMDGVEIDNRPEPSSYVDDSDDKTSSDFKELLEGKQATLVSDTINKKARLHLDTRAMVNLDSVNNKEEVLDLDTINRILNGANKTDITDKRNLILTETNVQDIDLKSYLDVLKDKHAKEVVGDVLNKDIINYSDMLNYIKKDNLQNINEAIVFDTVNPLIGKTLGSPEFREQAEDEHNLFKLDQDAIISRQTTNEQDYFHDKNLSNYLNAISKLYASKNKNSKQDERLNSDDIEAYVVPKHPTNIDQTNDKYIVQDDKPVFNAIKSKYISKERDISKDKAVNKHLNVINSLYSTKDASPDLDLTSILNDNTKEKDILQDKGLEVDLITGQVDNGSNDLIESIEKEEDEKNGADDAVAINNENTLEAKDNGESIINEDNQKEKEVNETKIDEDWPSPFFKYALDDGEPIHPSEEKEIDNL